MNIFHIIKKTISTEKLSIGIEKHNRYGMYVNLKANKHQIKEAVEKIHGVKVLNVKTSILPGKLRRAGKRIKKTSKSKKAYVQLAEDQSLKALQDV